MTHGLPPRWHALVSNTRCGKPVARGSAGRIISDVPFYDPYFDPNDDDDEGGEDDGVMEFAVALLTNPTMDANFAINAEVNYISAEADDICSEEATPFDHVEQTERRRVLAAAGQGEGDLAAPSPERRRRDGAERQHRPGQRPAQMSQRHRVAARPGDLAHRAVRQPAIGRLGADLLQAGIEPHQPDALRPQQQRDKFGAKHRKAGRAGPRPAGQQHRQDR